MQKNNLALQQHDKSSESENEIDIRLNDNTTSEQILVVDDDPMNI